MKASILNFIATLDEVNENISPNNRYKELLCEESEIIKKIKYKLDVGDEVLFKQLETVQAEMESEIVSDYFKAGIKFGIRFILECMSD